MISDTPVRPLASIEPVMRADALAHVVFERRDIASMSRFLEDFGFLACGEGGGRRYFRGFGPLPFCVQLVPAERDAFVGFALVAGQAEDLEALAAAEGVPVEPVDQPGGGRRVRLFDPDGRRVDLVHGFTPLEPHPTRAEPPALNTPFEKGRLDATVRTPAQPSPVFHLGHVVLQTPDFAATADWYRRRFGFLASDVLGVGDGSPVMGFFRFDRGARPADHHSLAILGGPGAGLLHVSTETLDLDAVGQGQQHLRARGWTHHWGIGRHVLGSQVFDYWKDPAGDEWEHYADGDVMTAAYPTGYHSMDRGGLWAWGDDLPDDLRPKAPPPPGAPPAAHAAFEALSLPPRPWLP